MHCIQETTHVGKGAVRARLNDHLRQWLGQWPPSSSVELSITTARDEPGWDGRVRPIQGVIGPEGSIISVSPNHALLFEGVDLESFVNDASAPDAHRRFSTQLGTAISFGMPLFRWSEKAALLPDRGIWANADDPRLPDWLRPFNGGVLVSLDRDGRYMAGVGLKRHNDIAREISVGTDPEFRGRGLATHLVAQAARRIIADGGVPIYQHGDDNVGSARVAEAAGFPDRGWYMIEMYPGAASTIRG